MVGLSELMTSDVIVFTPDQPIEEAIRTLIDNHISGAPVVDKSNKILGVVSEADLLKVFWETRVRLIGDIMTHSPRSFHVNTPVADVVDCLMSNTFRRVLIHDSSGQLVGLVSRADLMPSILDALLKRINTRS